MFVASFRHLECLVLMLICLATAPFQLPGFNPASAQSAGRQHDGRWKYSLMALASSLAYAPHGTKSASTAQFHSQEAESNIGLYMPTPGPAQSSYPTASEPAGIGKRLISNDSLTSFSSLPLPGLSGVTSHSTTTSVASPSPTVGIAQPPLSVGSDTSYLSPTPATMWLTHPSRPARLTLSSSNPALSSSAPAPLLSPPIDTSNVSVTLPDAPLPQPSSGCCLAKMVPKPGLPSSSCVCVYPVRLQLLVEHVSTTLTNWSGVFQQDLASQLGVKTIQIQITAFQFNGSNILLDMMIGPLSSSSFSSQEATNFKTKLDEYEVHFNSSLFGNYTLVQFQFYEPVAPPSIQAPNVGVSRSPMGQPMLLTAESGDDGDGHKLTLWLTIVIATAAVMIVLVLFLLVVWKCHQHCRAERTTCKGAPISTFDTRSSCAASIPRSITTRLFTFEELRQATNNFNPENVLGEGGFGCVYKGVLKDGTAVAIKRFGGGGQGDREFVVEVEMLSRLHHRNLVKLIGYYASGDSSQHLLCYELIPNGSLEAWLHGPQAAVQPLDWDTRLKIALDAARGLAYLHEDSQPCVIHRDFKASNILLENSFHAKVADFGLAKLAPEGPVNYVATQVMGTFGYVAPEYAMTGHLLVKSDVYSYGVVLLELLSGKKPVDMSQAPGQENLVTWARPILRDRERLWEFADSRLSNKYPKEDFMQVAAIAAACVSPEASQRPTMGEVVQSLRMLQRQSDYTTSGERTTDDILPLVVPRRSFVASIQNAHLHASAAFESDGSSSIFSSGPFSGLALDNEVFSRSAVFSEDLHEGR